MSINHPLYNWLKSNDKDFSAFAKTIGLKSEKSLYRYFSNDRRPSNKLIPKIKKATNGAITANDFFGGAQ